MPGRVGAVDTAGQNRDRLPADREDRAVRGAFDPVRGSGDNDAFLIGHACRQLACDVLAVGGGGSGAGDRDAITQRRRQERCRPERPQEVRGTLTQVIQPGGPFLICRDERAELATLRLSHPDGQLGCDPSSEAFAPHQRVGAGKARHRIVGLDQPQRLDPADLGEDASGGGVVRLGEHRQRDSCHPLALHLLRQRRHDRCPLAPRSPTRYALARRRRAGSPCQSTVVDWAVRQVH